MATSGTLDPATLVPPGVTGNVLSRAADVELAVFDVDGVLTEGALHYGPNGEETKVFNTLDGHGIKMLQSAGVVVAIISGRESKALGKRAGDLGIHHLYMGVENELEMRSATADPVFLLKRRIELKMEQTYRDYFSKYSMVTFREDLPYSYAMKIGRAQDEILMKYAAGINSMAEFDDSKKC